MNPLAKNTEVWNNMFDWIERRNASRKYPNETVVTWILGYANTHKSLSKEERKVLDVGCGWCQSISVFINEGFTYYGVDVTGVAFPRREELAGIGWSDNVHLSIFNPPKLDYPDNYFSHAFSTEALHLNPDKEAMTAIIAEVYRVLRPGGRFMATLMTPDYWYMPLGTAEYVSEETIEVLPNHVEKNRIGARYFVFKDEAHIKSYFSDFSKVWIGKESRVFGEYPEKTLHHWIVSVEK